MEKLYYNGQIITMTSNRADAVLVSDGKIKKVGIMELVKQSVVRECEWIDLQGKCLMPSFIDSHSHIVMNGRVADFVDLSNCRSFADIVFMLERDLTEQNKKRILVGFGYDHNFLKEKCHPDKSVLDQVSAEIPIVILHISGHMGSMNSIALKLLGIDENTENLEGGKIGRICGSREPNGYVEEGGLAGIQHILQEERLNVDVIQERMQKTYLENGITTAQDGASTEKEMTFLKHMADRKKLKMDVVAYPLITADGVKLMNKYQNLVGIYENHLKLGGYKIMLDGSPQGCSAWLSKPYSCSGDGYCGYPALDDSTVMEYVLAAVKEKKQILAHCNGDAASEQFLKIYEECMSHENMKLDLRPVMVHCQTVRNDQLDRMAKLRMIGSMFVGHVWYWGDVHMKNLGAERGNHISPARDAIDRGVVINFHQDTPITKPNMLHSIWCAVNRVSYGENVIGKEQKITVYEALKAVTINAAYQYFEENEKGSIEEGKRADLIILDHSPLEVDASNIADIRVLETIKDGVTLYKV